MASPSKKLRLPGQRATSTHYLVILSVTICAGYVLGYVGSKLFASTEQPPVSTSISSTRSLKLETQLSSYQASPHKWPGDSIHSVMTSSGDHYQNFQGRIMYATYKLVQKMPGGERLTGFTRILHRTVPDILMDEIPTFHIEPIKPQCDGWCDYPVSNRPPAIKGFFEAAAKNKSMIQGAWVFMLECDYVWMQPMQVPGSAYDPSVPGLQFLYDYIIPHDMRTRESMRKLYNGPATDIPASGPAPVLLRWEEWNVLSADYVRLSARMEADEGIKRNLEWVREMYAWDAACAHHKEIKIITELHTNSSTIIQPPFDENLGRAALCHYTWGALYHEGLPSKKAKLIYKWEKRDYNDMKYALKVPQIPMPPEFKTGLFLEFDAILTRQRHDMVVKMLTQMNKAIATLPDLTEKWKEFEPKLNTMKKVWEIKHKAEEAAKASKVVKSTTQ